MLVEFGAGSVLDEVLLASARYKAYYENFSRTNSSIDEYRRIIQSGELGKMETLDINQMVGVVGAPRLMAMYKNAEALILVLGEAIETLKRSLDLTSVFLAKSFDGETVPKIDFEVLDEYIKYLKPLPTPQLDEDQMYSLMCKGGVAGMAKAR